jgi:Lrp/AsnC family transcriptional regulator
MIRDLDPIDRHILAILQQDASPSTAEIAARVGLSQSPCWRRIERLEAAGCIRKRVALLNPQKLGLNLLAFAHVKLESHAQRALPQFEEAVRLMPEVVECHTVLGETDYLLRVVTRDLPAYERLLREKLGQIASVQFTSSTIALSTIKSTTELPLDIGD